MGASFDGKHCTLAYTKRLGKTVQFGTPVKFARVGAFEPGGRLLVKNYGEERAVNLKAAVVIDEAHFPEFVHE